MLFLLSLLGSIDSRFALFLGAAPVCTGSAEQTSEESACELHAGDAVTETAVEKRARMQSLVINCRWIIVIIYNRILSKQIIVSYVYLLDLLIGNGFGAVMAFKTHL